MGGEGKVLHVSNPNYYCLILIIIKFRFCNINRSVAYRNVKMKATASFETCRTRHPASQCHIPEDQMSIALL